MTMHEHSITYIMVSAEMLTNESCQRVAVAQYEINWCPALKYLQPLSDSIRKRQFIGNMAKSSQYIEAARGDPQTLHLRRNGVRK
jgi:hypothetical protein